jgi:hypothetical protein
LYGLEGYDPLVVSLSAVLLMLVAFGAACCRRYARRASIPCALRWQ